MPVTQAECEDDSFFTGSFTAQRIAERCMLCDTSIIQQISLPNAGICGTSITVAGGGEQVRSTLYATYESLLQNYKDLFHINLSTAITNPPTAQLTTQSSANGEHISPELDPDELYLTRTIGGDTLDSDETEYEDRQNKCLSLKCGEDCNNDSDCYWHIPFDFLNPQSDSRCTCKPNIFINDENIFGRESLQKKLAEDFYNIYAEELQENCRISSSFSLFHDQGRNPGREEIFCADLERTMRISEAIFSSQTNRNVNEIYETCLDREGTHRENILKKCLSRPIEICKDENDDNQDCIEPDFSYYGIISDIFGYYFLRNTSYENPDRCECNLLEINDAGPPHYSLDEKQYLYRNECEDNRYGIPHGICGHNMPTIQSYLDANESLITDVSSATVHMTGILNKNKCERTNSIKQGDIDYFHSRLYCDPSNDNTFNLTDDIDQMITNKYYETVSEYNIGTGTPPQSIPDNNLREWDSATQEYTLDGANQIDYDRQHCTSNIHKCMGFEPKEVGDSYDHDLYEKMLDSHYYVLPLDVSHTTRDLGYIRCFSALNNHYLGDLTLDFPYGKLYGHVIENIYNITRDETLAPTVLDQQYQVVQAVNRGDSISSHVEEGQVGDEMGSIDRFELEETLLTVYKLDYLNTIRDYTMLALLSVCSLIFLYFYSLIILFVHIPWIIIYISYIKINEYFQ